MTPITLIGEPWADYGLIDSGYGRKLERYGPRRFIRPEPQALWAPASDEWTADGEFVPGADEDGGGQWRFSSRLPEKGWTGNWEEVRFTMQPTPFRHLSFFPDMAPVWTWMRGQLAGMDAPTAMNLFGYTGVGSLALAAKGAAVTHVDASKKSVEAARANAEAIALTLSEVGITVDCLPLLDVRVPETHTAIGDRAFGNEPLRVASLGRAVIDGLRSGGVVGIVKHMPGQGRALVDSHLELPAVSASTDDLAQDLAPFAALKNAPMGMTAHVVFEAWDTERCATMSPTVIQDIIRGQIGFTGLLMSDDLDMKALKGDVPQRAADCVAAGCDIALNCWGRFDEMVAIANLLPEITADARARLDTAMATIRPVDHFDRIAALTEKRDALLALA